MIKISEEKWEKLPKVEDHLSEKYGLVGSASRKEFQAKAEAWYYAELLREERKRQKITQKELGERIGKKREYISALEQGQTDMQLSTFMLISNALGLKFSLVVGSFLLFMIFL
ncbi:MAG: helix-turn-helix transcriptional regulator [Prevotella sp.]|nr:helix-turn-helix transcriptional regulator [Prevotella sp.]